MRNRNGFTLIELLVVISIIAVLAGLLIPGIGKALKQAKTNRALSEMQHLSTVITQVYSEVGYYVPLESLTKTTSAADLALVRRWVVSLDNGATANDYINGRDDSTITNNLSLPTAPLTLDVSTMWNGPYTTYKNYSTTTNRPLDPWGTMGNSDIAVHQYRMFWITRTGPAALLVPAGATGAMVIISAGPDKIYQCGIGSDPENAVQANFNAFNPASDKGDDVYFIFNAGIQ